MGVKIFRGNLGLVEDIGLVVSREERVGEVGCFKIFGEFERKVKNLGFLTQIQRHAAA